MAPFPLNARILFFKASWPARPPVRRVVVFFKARYKDQPGYALRAGPKGKNRWMQEEEAWSPLNREGDFGQDALMSSDDHDFLEGRSRARGELTKQAKPTAPGTLSPDQVSKLEGDAKSYVLKNGRKTGNEYLTAIDLRTGKRLAQGTSHDPGRVYLPDEVTKLASDPTCKLAYYHNHPNSYSISPGDLAVMGKRPGLLQIIVYGHNGSWFRAERRDFREFEMVLDAAKHEIWQQTGLARKRSLFLENFEAHLINLALARAGVINYQFQFDKNRQRFYANEQSALENMVDAAVLKIKRIRGF